MTDIVYQTNLGGNLTLRATNTNSNPIITIPDTTGNVVTTGDTATVTANMITPGALSQTATYLQGSSGSVSRTIQNKLQESISVKDFGAVGDGVTDDTVAIQAAINATQNNSPEVLYFPSGLYKVSSTITITGSITLLGLKSSEYSSGSRIFQSVSGDLFKFNPSNVGGLSFSVENLTMYSSVSGTGNLINIVKGSPGYNSWRIKNCTFQSPQQLSIFAIGDDIQITDCTFDVSGFSGKAIQLGSNIAGEIASDVRITGCNFYNVPTFCILHYNAKNVIVANNQLSNPNDSTTVSFYEAFDSSPTLVNSISITGNNIFNCNKLLAINNGSNITFVGNNCNNLGLSGASLYNAILLSGTINNVVINSNVINGDYGTKNIINCLTTTLSYASITQNVINAITSNSAISLEVGTITNVLAWPNVVVNAAKVLSAINTSSVGYLINNLQVVNTAGGTVTPNLALGNSLLLSVTGTGAITIAAPINALDGLQYTIIVLNSSGTTMGTITWASGANGFSLNTFNNPSNGFEQSVTFKYSLNLQKWLEINRTTTQILA